MELNKKNEIFLYLLLSVLFAITIQQFPFFKGNSLHLLHAVKSFEFNKLQNDWIANQTNHLPLFTYFNNIILRIFPINFLHIVHFILLTLCSLFLFLICKKEFPNLNKSEISEALNAIFESITEAVALDEKVEIRGFGTFSKKYIRPRKFVNPKTKKISYLALLMTRLFL